MIVRIAQEHRQLKPERWIPTAAAFPFYVIGYLLAVLVRLAVWLIKWPVAAVRTGWRDSWGR
jgi:hypothetical protein